MSAAISTRYAGCWFRSRLEARWAVFFDHLGIEWQYEPQGYYVGWKCVKKNCSIPHPSSQHRLNGGSPGIEELKMTDDCPSYHRYRYLPDFYLPRTETWVEVKGSADQFNWDLLAEATDSWGRGLPGLCDSYRTTRGLLLLGPVPNPHGSAVAHPVLQHHKGGLLCYWLFTTGAPVVFGSECTFDSTATSNWEGDDWVQAIRMNLGGAVPAPLLPIISQVEDAYFAARSARFEHESQSTSRSSQIQRTVQVGRTTQQLLSDLLDRVRPLPWDEDHVHCIADNTTQPITPTGVMRILKVGLEKTQCDALVSELARKVKEYGEGYDRWLRGEGRT